MVTSNGVAASTSIQSLGRHVFEAPLRRTLDVTPQVVRVSRENVTISQACRSEKLRSIWLGGPSSISRFNDSAKVLERVMLWSLC